MFKRYISLGRKLTINDLIKSLEGVSLTGSFIVTEYELIFETKELGNSNENNN